MNFQYSHRTCLHWRLPSITERLIRVCRVLTDRHDCDSYSDAPQSIVGPTSSWCRAAQLRFASDELHWWAAAETGGRDVGSASVSSAAQYCRLAGRGITKRQTDRPTDRPTAAANLSDDNRIAKQCSDSDHTRYQMNANDIAACMSPSPVKRTTNLP